MQLARLAPTSAPDRLAARVALTRLAAAGVLDSAHVGEGPTAGRVRIVTFGRFEVLVDGVAVPAETWQSRRARELLRLLVCRRGRAIPRMEICEALWPDDDPDRTTHRLSVLLSIVRGVLGPDAIVADQACVALDIDPGPGRCRAVPHRRRPMRPLCTNEARSPTPAVAGGGRRAPTPTSRSPTHRTTTRRRRCGMRRGRPTCRRCGCWPRSAAGPAEHDQAAGYLRRLLGDDRYDEDAHRTLIGVLNRAGRHGQARLAAARYRSAMADIGLRPACDVLSSKADPPSGRAPGDEPAFSAFSPDFSRENLLVGQHVGRVFDRGVVCVDPDLPLDLVVVVRRIPLQHLAVHGPRLRR